MRNTTHTVLVVSPSSTTTNTIRAIFNLGGSTALTATDSKAASEVITTQSPDVIIIDEALPSDELTQLLEYMTKSESTIPLLHLCNRPVTTGDTDTNHHATEYPCHELLLAASTTTLVLENTVDLKALETEKLYQEIFENANDIVYTHDLEGHYTSLNKKGRELTGYSADEATTVDSAKVSSPKHMALARRMLKTKLERGSAEPTIYEIDLLTKDGKSIPVEISSQLIFRDGKPFRVLGIARDITARKQSEAALKLAYQELKDANERADQDIKRLSSNITNLALTLSTARELPDVFAALLTFTKQSIPCDTIVLALYNEERNEAIPRFLWTDETQITIQDPQPIELQQGPAGLAILSKQIVISNNLSATSIRENASSLNPQQNGHYPILSIMAVPMRTAETVVGLLEIQTSEPGAYTEEQKTPLVTAAQLAANAIENIRLIGRDRQRERQLHQAQKIETIGRLAAHVAHDFNNILTVIYGRLDLLNTSLPVGNDARPHVIQIRECARRAQTLCSQLLSFSRRQMLQPKTRELNKLIAKNAPFIKQIIGEDIFIDTSLDKNLPFAYIDESQIEQILMNLAVNARDAMPTGGTITIETKRIDPDHPKHSRRNERPEILLTFSDTGIGMDQDTLKQIFEPFFSTKEEGKGTGLGLAMVYGSIAQSGGTISVSSKPGRGTTFSLQLPAAEEETEIAQIETDDIRTERHGSQRILVAEDDERVRETVVTTLKSHGYSVLWAPNGREALRLLNDNKGLINLLLTDLLMPQMNGRDLANQARSISPQIKILFISGYSTEHLTNEDILANDMALINKPFTPIDLLHKVRDVFELQAIHSDDRIELHS